MANEANLKPWKPGQTGNPNGRPATRSVSTRLRELLEQGKIGGVAIKDGKQVADLLTEVIMKQALKGNYQFANMILDRTEGKVADKLETTSATDREPNAEIQTAEERVWGKNKRGDDGD